MISKLKEQLNNINVFRVLFRSLPILWKAAPLETFALSVLLLIQGLVPVLLVWLTKVAVDSVVALAGGESPSIQVFWLVVLWGGALFFESIIGPGIFMLVGNLNEKLTAHINILLMEKANKLPGLYEFEDQAFYDDLKILQKQASSRPVNLIIILVAAGRQFITLIGMLFLLSTLSWWVPLLILIFVIPQANVYLKLQGATWKALVRRSPESRRMDYYNSIMLTDIYAKEVRIFNLGSYFVDQFQSVFTTLHSTMRGVRKEQTLRALPAVLFSVFGNIFVFGWTINRAMSGALSAGDVLLLFQSLAIIQRNLTDLFENFGFLYEKILFFEKLHQFLEHKSILKIYPQPNKQSVTLQKSIIFKNVTFSYPDGTLALDNVSFKIHAGEKIALVGENGAGKSTIIKLLCRFYDPTDGSILIDGIDLRELDLSAWRRQMNAVFQDFGKYHLTVSENINLGNIDDICNEKNMLLAAEKAGFAEVAKNLPDQYETMLGKQFGGTDLSGGQWQKLAIARAFAGDSEVLILDEPTASLDPRSEHELFMRFAELADGKTTVMVTHRLASVQMADRILVIKHGKLVENGTHEEMISLDGEYTTLYKMQVELFASNL